VVPDPLPGLTGEAAGVDPLACDLLSAGMQGVQERRTRSGHAGEAAAFRSTRARMALRRAFVAARTALVPFSPLLTRHCPPPSGEPRPGRTPPRPGHAAAWPRSGGAEGKSGGSALPFAPPPNARRASTEAGPSVANFRVPYASDPATGVLQSTRRRTAPRPFPLPATATPVAQAATENKKKNEDDDQGRGAHDFPIGLHSDRYSSGATNTAQLFGHTLRIDVTSHQLDPPRPRPTRVMRPGIPAPLAHPHPRPTRWRPGRCRLR